MVVASRSVSALDFLSAAVHFYQVTTARLDSALRSVITTTEAGLVSLIYLSAARLAVAPKYSTEGLTTVPAAFETAGTVHEFGVDTEEARDAIPLYH